MLIHYLSFGEFSVIQKNFFQSHDRKHSASYLFYLLSNPNFICLVTLMATMDIGFDFRFTNILLDTLGFIIYGIYESNGHKEKTSNNMYGNNS